MVQKYIHVVAKPIVSNLIKLWHAVYKQCNVYTSTCIVASAHSRITVGVFCYCCLFIF